MSKTVKKLSKKKLHADDLKISTGGKTRSGHCQVGRRSRNQEWHVHTQKIGFGWYSTRITFKANWLAR